MLTHEQNAVIRDCVQLSLTGQIHFGEVVRRLIDAGVERYHADYCREESTYYLSDGSSLVIPVPHPPGPIAEMFDPQHVEAAIRGAQRGEIDYPEFLRRTMQAGCVGYHVYLAGQQVCYLGRGGDQHLEPFPNRASRRRSAVEFLTLAASGQVREAFERYVHPHFRHHNPHFAGDRESLLQGMQQNASAFPEKTLTIQRSLEDGNLVTLHSRVQLRPEHAGVAVVHLFRFEGDLIAELWDVGQPVPDESPNQNGVF